MLEPALPAERPPEAISSVSTVMSLICMAEAQVSYLDVNFLFSFLDIHQRIMAWKFVEPFLKYYYLKGGGGGVYFLIIKCYDQVPFCDN